MWIAPHTYTSTCVFQMTKNLIIHHQQTSSHTLQCINNGKKPSVTGRSLKELREKNRAMVTDRDSSVEGTNSASSSVSTSKDYWASQWTV